MKHQTTLDPTDRQLLDAMQTDSSISNAELARRVQLSPPAVHARLKRLRDEGYIQTTVSLLDPERLGYDMLCFIQVSLQVHQPEAVQAFREQVAQMPEVLECYHVTGSIDYLLKVLIRDKGDLQRFLMEGLTPIPGIARLQTSIVLAEIKSTTVIPLDTET